MPKVRKAVIAAAGRGTRQYPASAAVPKPLFPLVDRDGVTKPVIQIILEEAVDSGIEEVCLVTPPGEDKLYRAYFRRMGDDEAAAFKGKDAAMLASEKLASLGRRLRFVEQASPEGFGHAVFQAKGFVGDHPFLLLLADHVYVSDSVERCARQAIAVFEEFAPDAVTAVQPTHERELHDYGTIRGRPVDAERGVYKAELIVEKPSVGRARRELQTPGISTGHYLAHFGIHVFSPRIFESLDQLIRGGARERGEFQLTAAQEHLRQSTDNYLVSIIRGQRYDTGAPFALMETQLALALTGIHRAAFCESITRILATQARN
jgi:UTP--glucose-1-phosphate uridylyltransferase